jgi:RHS repeat-associated protein
MSYHSDFIGSVHVLTDATGAVVELYDYDAYGIPLNDQSGALTPFRYVGQLGYYKDQDHGLMLLGARYYDPFIGRFITQDPIGYAGGPNLYAYVSDNPVSYSDPSGLLKDIDLGRGLKAHWDPDIPGIHGQPGQPHIDVRGYGRYRPIVDECDKLAGVTPLGGAPGLPGRVMRALRAGANGKWAAALRRFRALWVLAAAFMIADVEEAYAADTRAPASCPASHGYPNTERAVAGAAGGLALSWLGVKAGGFVGTLIAPGPGTVIGGLLGGSAFGVGGYSLGAHLPDWIRGGWERPRGGGGGGW